MDYWTTNHVAEHYQTSPGTVRYWRHTGFGPKGVRVGRRVLYPRDEIERFDAVIAERVARAAGGDAA